MAKLFRFEVEGYIGVKSERAGLLSLGELTSRAAERIEDRDKQSAIPLDVTRATEIYSAVEQLAFELQGWEAYPANGVHKLPNVTLEYLLSAVRVAHDAGARPRTRLDDRTVALVFAFDRFGGNPVSMMKALGFQVSRTHQTRTGVGD